MVIAEGLDEERAAGRVRGPLHGLPMLIKENIDTADRMTTTAGSLALEGSIAPDDAFVVKRLREAAVVLLGKTNLSEWANFRSTRASTGWSSRGGQTRNPYGLDRSPGGSSSGSGVAAACGMCAAAVGTETDGSVVIPSSMNALAGIKPTLGLVSRSGIIPIAHSQDTAGPMARSVRDAAALLQGMVGYDAEDPFGLDPSILPPDLLSMDHSGLRGARVGLVSLYCGNHEAVDRIVEEAVVALGECGAEVFGEVQFAHFDELDELDDEVMLYEIKAGLNAYFQRLGPQAPVKSLADVIDFNERHAERTMPYFGQEHFHRAQARGDLTEKVYLDALARVKQLTGVDGIDAALTRHRLDVLIAPTIGPPWSIDLVTGDHRSPCSSTAAALAGYPSVSVPAGYIHGLPVGLLFFGGARTDAKLIRYAHAFEQATNVRVAPNVG